MGIGIVGASAAVASVDDVRQFKNAPQSGAWCGIVPRHHTSIAFGPTLRFSGGPRNGPSAATGC
jgi:hypothetical protein